MKSYVIAANWKMYKTPSQVQGFVSDFLKLYTPSDSTDAIICAPFTHLDRLQSALKGSEVKWGAQNVYTKAEEGAFTGEISVLMLSDLGCSHVIVGHSERRQLFFETNETINQKLNTVFKAQLTPIFCVGETLQERGQNQTLQVIQKQLEEGLKGLESFAKTQPLIIAYEPVWAIGTGKVATPAQAQEVHASIRQWLVTHLGEQAAKAIRLQYGGSVKPDNAAELLSMPDIDGALVGGASLDPASFKAILEAAVNQPARA